MVTLEGELKSDYVVDFDYIKDGIVGRGHQGKILEGGTPKIQA